MDARAKRRFTEQVAKGEPVTFDQVMEALKKRDLQDSTRAAAPLKPADDAILVDSTEMDFQQTVAHIRELVRVKLGV